MTKKALITLKAFFLLIVFFLNTAVGIACALAPHGCCHESVVKTHHHEQGNRNCCNDSVLQFQLLDKSFEQQLKTVVHMPVAFITGHFISPAVTYCYYQYPIIRQELPTRDIRVSIQSFQI
jgi:hypothetical protein